MEFKEALEIEPVIIDKRKEYFYDIPEQIYKVSINAENISLKEFTGLDIYMHGDMKTIRFFRHIERNQVIAISLNIPYYKKYHPERMMATEFNMFTVFEYTKQDAYTTQEIDWQSLKVKFNECLLKICRFNYL